MGAHLFVGQLAEADRKTLLNNIVKLVRAFLQGKDQVLKISSFRLWVCELACDKMCEMFRRCKYRLDSGSGQNTFWNRCGPFLNGV